MHPRDVKDGVFERLNFNAQAGLSPVGRLVVLDEAYDYRLERARWVVCRGLVSVEQRIQRGGIREGSSAEGREPRVRIQVVLDAFSSRVL